MDIKEIVRTGGGASKLARALGIHYSSVLGWKEVPPLRVLEVERVTGIPRHLIRPDLYPRALRDDAA